MTWEEAKTLFDYDAWATERILEVASALPPERYSQNLGSSHGGIHGTLVHAYAADRIWLDRLSGIPQPAMIPETAVPTLAVLRQQWKLWRAEMAAYLASLSDAKLNEPFSHQDTKGNSYTYPLYHVLQHIINHSTYHRGQVVSMLRQQGARPVNSDLIYYYRSVGRS